VFAGALSKNYTLWEAGIASLLLGSSSPPPYPNYAGLEATAGIRCTETAFKTDNLTEILPILDEFLINGDGTGDTEPIGIFMACAQWKVKAKEIYTGGFHNITTKNPVLFVGNTFDPLTPLVSAYNTSAGFDGSVVLQHDGYGVSRTNVNLKSEIILLIGPHLAHLSWSAVSLHCKIHTVVL
jgi:hypothetical protein